MATHWTLPQRDLFEPSPPVSQLMEDRATKGAGFTAGAVGGSDESQRRRRRSRTERRRAMTKISLDHLARSAVVYVRQSTAEQVAHNLESQRRQYGLADRARLLGWQDVEVIDDDLGRSAGGIRRPASRGCSRRSARGASAPSCRSRRRGWPATGVTGIPFWSFAAWSARSLSMRTAYMIPPRRTTGCCSG